MKFRERYGKLIAMSAAALGMTAVLSIESSMAYFTTYVSAGGGQEVSLGASTTIQEDVVNMEKHITITNPSTMSDCFVRVKVFSGREITVEVNGDADWSYDSDDGYWYYAPILAAGESTSVLNAKIQVPEEGFDRDDFNVVVVQECTPAVYDSETGEASADWNMVYEGLEGEEAGN